MCDFSLESYRTRLAREGETYKTARFPSGTIGIAPMESDGMPVCVPYDTQLIVEDVPQPVQERFGIGARELATLVRIEHGPWHDGIKFGNGREVSLQQLGPGAKVTVTMLLENAGHRWRIAAMT